MRSVKNGYRFDKNGWIYVHIEGNPYDRGFAHGKLVVNEFKKMWESNTFITFFNEGFKLEFFIKSSNKIFRPYIKKHFPEYLEEMRGIAAGLSSGGFKRTLDDIIAWNGMMILVEYWWPNIKHKYLSHHHSRESFGGADKGASDRCSAFIAVGDATKDGKIVLAHNTFDQFVNGQNTHMILSIKPDTGHSILMQSTPGYIWSGTDFFVTSGGFLGSETTIGGFMPYKVGSPIFCRIRKAMQYGNNLSDYEKILLKDNTGGYANAWIFGDTNENEIMRIELGLKYWNTERKKSGFFIGFNAPYDSRIRNLECKNTGFFDIRRHQGARHVRLTQLMNEYYGKIDVAIGKKILADHYDVYLKKINPCSRTVDSHYDLDDRAFMSQASRPKPYQARGAVDGKVIDSNDARNMSFWARWGNSSGMNFDANKFCDKHIQWDYLRPYLRDRPSQPWSFFSFNAKTSKPSKKTRKKKRRSQSQNTSRKHKNP